MKRNLQISMLTLHATWLVHFAFGALASWIVFAPPPRKVEADGEPVWKLGNRPLVAYYLDDDLAERIPGDGLVNETDGLAATVTRLQFRHPQGFNLLLPGHHLHEWQVSPAFWPLDLPASSAIQLVNGGTIFSDKTRSNRWVIHGSVEKDGAPILPIEKSHESPDHKRHENAVHSNHRRDNRGTCARQR